MLGKRPRPTMRRTSSVSLIGAGSVNGDSSPLSEHPKEKLKSSNCAPPSACAPRQVIGFHPKAYIAEELELTAPISPRRVPQSAKSPGGSPRSGLVDLLGRAPWGRKDEGGVGLGIVVALSGSQEEVGIVRDDGRQYCGVPPAYNGWRTPGQSHHHSPSPFAPRRASPPIPIVNPGGSAFTSDRVAYIQNHPPAYDNPLCHSVKADSVRSESMFAPGNGLGSQQRGGGGSRPNSTLSTTVTWSKPSSVVTSGITTLLWHQQQNHHAHSDVEMEPPSPQVFHLRHHFAPVAPPTISPGGYSHSFLEECHLCKRHLVGNDIYIYRGDRAFCSPECRLQQITIDERRDKCSSAVMKMGSAADPRSATERTRVAGTAAAA